jgi:hypothetical protein
VDVAFESDEMNRKQSRLHVELASMTQAMVWVVAFVVAAAAAEPDTLEKIRRSYRW